MLRTPMDRTHLQNMWLHWLRCVKVLSELYFGRLIKRGRSYAAPMYIIFDEMIVQNDILTQLSCDDPFGFYAIVSVFFVPSCSFN
jgi:hypothetical protein